MHGDTWSEERRCGVRNYNKLKKNFDGQLDARHFASNMSMMSTTNATSSHMTISRQRKQWHVYE